MRPGWVRFDSRMHGEPNASAEEIGFRDPQPRRVRFCGADTAGQTTPVNRGHFMRRARGFSVCLPSPQVNRTMSKG